MYSTPEQLASRDLLELLEQKKATFSAKMCFEKMLLGYLRNGECYSFQTFVIVFSTPENLPVGISGALGTNVELILTTRSQFWGVDLLADLPKYELILTTRCQYQGVDLLADLPKLNSFWPLHVSTEGRSAGRSAKVELILTTRCVQHPWHTY